MTYEKIASIVHSVTMRFPRSDGSYPESWGNIPYDAQKQAADAVALIAADLEINEGISDFYSPEHLHELWLKLNEEAGWIHGETWCPINKTHPCMVPYEQLSDAQKLKDEIWGTLVPLLLSYKDTV